MKSFDVFLAPRQTELLHILQQLTLDLVIISAIIGAEYDTIFRGLL